MISDKRIAIKFLLVILFRVFVLGDAQVRCIEREREALLSFKSGLVDAYGILSSWQSNECCEWLGVECSNTTGHVTTLKCAANLRGKIGSSLLELHHLKHLELTRNDFGGIPIPEFIGSMKQLQHLHLKSCNFSGTIPPQLANLTNLRSLDLSGNDFGHFPVPEFIGSMKQLQHLYLWNSNFSGIVPPQLGNLTNLRSLDLSFNSLSSVSSFIRGSALESLEILGLSYNQLNGLIPDLRAFSSLTDLRLRRNNFTGSIPLSIGQLSKLQILDLSYNSLEGLVSESHFIMLDKLKSLDLSFNSLNLDTSLNWNPPFQLSTYPLPTAVVPNCWEKMPNLGYLNLANNSFFGEIPQSFGNLQQLVALQMHGNGFSGELPLNLRLCQGLRLIDVGGNKLTGEIPTWIGQLHEMQFVNLRRNKLQGSIPPEICNLTRIQVLDLSINNLSSIIPDCFNNFAILASKNVTYVTSVTFATSYDINGNEQYQYSSFQWKGKESEYSKNLHLLKLIDFSSNRLTGNIPKSFSNMRNLNSLNLSRNSLTGYIIPDIGKMETVNSLNLSQNQLSGKIPTRLAQIHALGVLDLSNNNLSGKIPSGTQLQSFIASAYAGNDGLCGNPLPKCPEDRLRPSATNPGGNVNAKDDSSLSFMQEVAISMVFGFIFGFWGVIGSFTLKKSWRISFFNLLDVIGDWLYVRIALFVSKWRRN
ncbi:receptor-like protein EIX1 [Salvia divinorum]|uniref:Receptor-like protein EIX1 n=1 Tax=Salvia divinorum TaxID=28513 RepID=A0ABD1HIH8_SALDI